MLRQQKRLQVEAGALRIQIEALRLQVEAGVLLLLHQKEVGEGQREQRVPTPVSKLRASRRGTNFELALRCSMLRPSHFQA
jgi:alkylation response protein AidB-like acyl-CoA dehydrogenase